MINKILPILEKVQRKYEFLDLTDKEVYMILHDPVYASANMEENFDEQFVEQIIEENIKKIIYSRLKEDEENLINRYIANNIVVSNDLYSNISSLIEFVSFFDQFDHEIQIFNIIISNSVMMSLLSAINNDTKFNLDEFDENIECWMQIYNTIINSTDEFVSEENYYPYRGRLDDSLHAYISEIIKYPLLNFEEEQELGYRIIDGDKESKEKLVNSNLRLVVSIAKRNVDKGLPLLDLIQEGNLGLMKAVEKYDPSLGFKFSSFATCWIKQYILRAIYNKSKNIRIPVYLHEKVTKYRKIKMNFIKENGYEPSIYEISEIMGLSVGDVEKIISLQYDTLSLNKIIRDEERNRAEAVDLFIPEEESVEELVARKSFYSSVVDLLDKCELNQREKEILILYYGLYDTEQKKLPEIAKNYKITKERVRQIKSDALMKIRNNPYVQENMHLYTENELSSIESLSYKRANSNKQLNTIYENYSDYTKQQVHTVLSCLKDKHKKLIVDRYGEDFNLPLKVSMLKKEDTKKFYGHLSRKMIRKLKLVKGFCDNNNNISDEKLIEELNLYGCSENVNLDVLRKISYYKMSEIYSHKGNALLALKLGYNDGKYFSNEELALIFDIKESMVCELLSKILNIYCEVAEEFTNSNREEFSNKVKSIIFSGC